MRSLPHLLVGLLLAGLAAGASSALARGWLRPVDGPLLRPFAVSFDRYAAGQHRGVDLGGLAGTVVRAACGGRVSFAGRVPRGGRTVSVRCGPLVATYQHLGVVAVRRGQVLMPGGPIGTIGRVRRNPHVHLGARDAATRAYVDPLALFADAPRGPPPPVPAAPRARRPLPLGPAPPRAALRPFELPAGRRVAPARPAASVRLPWPVWLGLGLVGLGLPLGGGLVAHRRRRARTQRWVAGDAVHHAG